KKFYGRRHGRTDNTVGFREVAEMTPGPTNGFLITSMTGQEFKSYSEVRLLLEQYHQDIYGDQPANRNMTSTDESRKDPMFGEASDTRAEDRVAQLQPFFEDSKDSGDELEAELKQMRNVRRHFRQLKTLCHNVIFITVNERVSQADPDLIVRRIFDDVEKTKVQQTRYTFKIYPIMSSFKSNVTSAKDAISSIINSKLSEQLSHPLANKPRLKYFIEFQVRGSYTAGKQDREKIIEAVASQVGILKPDWIVSRNECDVMIMIVALRKICCMTLLTNYFHYSKYNIHEFNKIHARDFDDKSSEKPTPRVPQNSGHVTKAQKRRDAKAAKRAEQIQRIEEAEKADENPQRRIEIEKLESLLSSHNLAIHDVESDGDCLYNALRHQLILAGDSNQESTHTVNQLRQSTRDYLAAHSERFLPFMTNDNGDPMSEQEYKKYCSNITNTKTWGGQIEITALAEVLARPIHVFQAEGQSPIISTPANASGKSPLLIAIANQTSQLSTKVENNKQKMQLYTTVIAILGMVSLAHSAATVADVDCSKLEHAFDDLGAAQGWSFMNKEHLPAREAGEFKAKCKSSDEAIKTLKLYNVKCHKSLTKQVIKAILDTRDAMMQEYCNDDAKSKAALASINCLYDKALEKVKAAESRAIVSPQVLFDSKIDDEKERLKRACCDVLENKQHFLNATNDGCSEHKSIYEAYIDSYTSSSMSLICPENLLKGQECGSLKPLATEGVKPKYSFFLNPLIKIKGASKMPKVAENQTTTIMSKQSRQNGISRDTLMKHNSANRTVSSWISLRELAEQDSDSIDADEFHLLLKLAIALLKPHYSVKIRFVAPKVCLSIKFVRLSSKL
ncbi:Deubiquitinase OTUD6B, partial [Fragariocoptes setiger]